MIKVALIGYGKMGKTIEEILLQKAHRVVACFNSEGVDEKELIKANVAIEFTRPEAAFGNVSICLKNQIPVVVGTTGWLHKYSKAVELCQTYKSALLYASNFSLGINVFFKINQKLARVMEAFDQYEVSIEEAHHTEKLDAPSGTAVSLAKQIEKNLSRKGGWTMDELHAKEQIHIEAKRIKDVSGTHVITYQSDIDTIQIKHEAHNRKGFALGAVMAAEFLNGKKGVYQMKDVLKL